MRYEPFRPNEVSLGEGVYEQRHKHNVRYLLSLDNANLLQNHYIESGIPAYPNLFGAWEGKPNSQGADLHWGWETPGSAVRGQFLGHWMSAAAREVSNTGDAILRVKLTRIIDELARCQREHGGEWVFSIPPLYMDHLAQGHPNGVPQYVLHKTLMGLVESYRLLGIAQAVDIAVRASAWIRRWASSFPQEQWDAILDVETGGMLEIWADLLECTHDDMFDYLLDRYWHHHLFDALLAGDDVLTNRHANTTIPEVIGAARAYETTGGSRWRDVVLAYWDQAVTRRGTFVTGGCNSGEVWCPPFEYAARRGDKNQELCTVFNMMRLADILFQWTGERSYLDYYERNSVNGILAQTHPETAMPAYYLPLEGGGRKLWGSATHDFWCCHGTAVQAGNMHNDGIFYRGGTQGQLIVVIARYVDACVEAPEGSGTLRVRMQSAGATAGDALHNESERGFTHRPQSVDMRIAADFSGPERVVLRLRIPPWCDGDFRVEGGSRPRGVKDVDGFVDVPMEGGHGEIDVHIRQVVHAVAIPDEPETVAYVDGPVVLAGLCDGERTLYGDACDAYSVLAPCNERQWGIWMKGYRTVHQHESVRLLPLYDIVDQRYSVFFPVQGRGSTDGGERRNHDVATREDR